MALDRKLNYFNLYIPTAYIAVKSYQNPVSDILLVLQ